MDAAPNLSWLPEIPLHPTFSRTSQAMSQVRMLPPVRMVQSCLPYPLVTYRTNPTRGMYRPDPKGIDSHSYNMYFPIPNARGGPPSYANYSPLTTSFNASVYGGSCNASQRGESHHHCAHLHGTSAVGGQSVGVCSDLSCHFLWTHRKHLLLHQQLCKLRQRQPPLKRMFPSSRTSPQSRTNHRTSASNLSRTKNHGLMPRRSLSLVFAMHHIRLALLVTSLRQMPTSPPACGGRR
jgi:hypothetical protein